MGYHIPMGLRTLKDEKGQNQNTRREGQLMGERQKNAKQPITKEMIFKITLYATYIVATLFLIKNLVGRAWIGAAVIAGGLAVYTVILLIIRGMGAKIEAQQFTASMGPVFLVFIISMFSGESYSDDFGLYLATMGLSGLYLRPRFTKIQAILIDILLLIQYFVCPEKADNLPQFLLCIATFSLAALMFYMVIDRGRAFIWRSQERAEQAEKLLESMATIGEDLQRNFENSSGLMENMKEANGQLEGSARELKQGSAGIAQGAREVEQTCGNVQECMQVAEEHIDALNGEVRTFENALADNRQNMEEMNRHMQSVKLAMGEAGKVFRLLEQQMKDITAVTEQLNSISSSTTMLALNASIEAARAGTAGAGFAVVASKVQELAVDSNKCSSQVAGVVGSMQSQIQKTTEQMGESTEAITASLSALEELQGGFDRLTKQFVSLYDNIEEQNNNVNQVDSIFEQLKEKIAEMSSYSEENQTTVEAMADVMEVYRDNMSRVIDDTKQIHELSASMLELSQGRNA